MIAATFMASALGAAAILCGAGSALFAGDAAEAFGRGEWRRGWRAQAKAAVCGLGLAGAMILLGGFA